MILDLAKFVSEGRPFWDELDGKLQRLEADPAASLSLEDAKRLHYLYQRASADLARVMTFAAEPAIRGHLEALVGRAYGEVHRQRRSGARWSPWAWFTQTFPQTFRRRKRAFVMACVTMLAGCLFGAGALLFDPESKPVLMGPFDHLLGTPHERVQREESAKRDRDGEAQHATFASELMTHNTKVSIYTLALGMSWGFGTIVMVFYNGVMLGAVVADYVADGQSAFVAGWLLPHGSVEIPSLIIAGQAGLVLGGALIGWGSRKSMRERLREVGPDLATLIGGVAVMLVWAGIIESFFSQYHEPVVPYAVKIAFGATQLAAVVAFFTLAGAKSARRAAPAGETGGEAR